jgi:uncharacterized protein YbcI
MRAVNLSALAALLAWFWEAAGHRPGRVRTPMLAGLLLATMTGILDRLERAGRAATDALGAG